MNKYLDILTKKIFELYDVYDSYAFASYIKEENKYKLVIKYEEKNNLHLLMLEKNINNEYELADEVYINFEDEESHQNFLKPQRQYPNIFHPHCK